MTKKNLYLTIINHIKNTSSLPNNSMKKQALNYYVSKLKKEDIIKKIGYGTWALTGKEFNPKQVQKQVQKMSKGSKILYKKAHDIRGHGYIISFKIPAIAGWFKKEEFFKKKGFNIKSVGIRGSGISITFRGYKVHIYKNSIIFYSPEKQSYFSESASQSFKYALYDITTAFKSLESLIGVSLRINKSYKFKVSRQHHAKVNDDLAKMYKEKGENIKISNENGFWLITDNSLNLNELETIHTKTSRTDMDSCIKPLFNDLKDYVEKTGEPIKLSEIIGAIGNVTKNQIMFAENIKTHMEVLSNINNSILELRNTLSGKESISPLQEIKQNLKSLDDVSEFHPLIKKLSPLQMNDLQVWIFERFGI